MKWSMQICGNEKQYVWGWGWWVNKMMPHIAIMGLHFAKRSRSFGKEKLKCQKDHFLLNRSDRVSINGMESNEFSKLDEKENYRLGEKWEFKEYENFENCLLFGKI